MNKEITKRQEDILYSVVKKYVKTAEPVGSSDLSYEFNLSSATIRNELNSLEKGGFLDQPHVSSGRIPTELAYKLYIKNNIEVSEYSGHNPICDIEIETEREYLKKVAKLLAESLNLAVCVAFAKNDVYYTGISYLFSQPEFKDDQNYLTNFSEVLDKLDDKIFEIFDDIKQDTDILFGSDNPFSEFCGTVVTKLQEDRDLLAILGPMRMDYKKAKEFMEFAKQDFNKRIKQIGFSEKYLLN